MTTLMDDFFETVTYTGDEQDIKPWREIADLATSDDEPDDPHPVPSQAKRRDLGGAGSGNFGHAGRPGEVGGSGAGTAAPTTAVKFHTWDTGITATEHIERVLGPQAVEGLTRIGESLSGTGAKATFAVDGGGAHGAEVGIALRIPGVAVVDARIYIDHDGRRHVKLEEMRINPEHQGKGIAKQFLQTAVAEFQQMGVTEIELHANLNVGGYAWAKFGFEDRDPGVLATQLKPMAYRLVKDPEKATKIVALLDREAKNPKLPQILAGLHDGDRHIGKELLQEESYSGWFGRLNLTDPEAMAKFHRYVEKLEK